MRLGWPHNGEEGEMSPLATFVRAITTSVRRLSVVLAAFALLAAGGSPSLAQVPVPRPAPADPAAAVAPLSPQQIDQLVAPIALYPDNLLAQILTASTYPFEVVLAARWSAAHRNVKGKRLEDAMQAQTWDHSVRALTSVPQVLQMMNDKVDWTRQLGEAYLAQPDDIAASVQRLRARADATGNLKSSNQLNVRRVAAPPPVVVGAVPEPEYIIIEPYEPDVIFVPVYDPWVAYGPWLYPAYPPFFFWYPPGYVAVGVIGFGAPIVVGAALWCNYNWSSRRVVVNVTQFNTFNRVTLANTAANQTWQYNPAHRGNVPFSNPALQQKFGNVGGVNVNQGSNIGTNQQLFGTKGVTGTNQQLFGTKSITGTNQQLLNPKGVTGTNLNTRGVTGTNQQFLDAKGAAGTNQQLLNPRGAAGTNQLLDSRGVTGARSGTANVPPSLNPNSGVNSPGGGQGFKKDSLGDTNLIDPKPDKTMRNLNLNNNLRMNNNLNLPRGALPNQNFRPGGNAKGGNAYPKGYKASPY
jgi:Protein of unknown function (DUF3300)